MIMHFVYFGYVRVRLPLADSEAVEGDEDADAEDKILEVCYFMIHYYLHEEI
jgi:hypothetical protein